MNPREIYLKADKLKAKIGPKAYIGLSVNTLNTLARPVSGSIYPDGPAGIAASIFVVGSDYDEVFELLEIEWAKRSAIKLGTLPKAETSPAIEAFS